MISRIRLAGLFALALCAFAVSAASASAAAPEFKPFTKTCTETLPGIGNYATKAACESPTGTETAEGKFHRHGIPFTDKSGISKLKVSSLSLTIECATSTSKGEITGPKTTGNNSVTYKECAEGTVKCNSAVDTAITPNEGTKGAAGVIITNTLTGTLKLNGSTTEETLAPTLGAGHDFTFIKCGTLEGAVRESVSGVVSPVGVSQPAGTLTFTEATGLTFQTKAATLTSTDEVLFSEAIEVT